MKRRSDLAVEKGYDAVELDNTDFFLSNTGFNLTRQDAIDYIRFLSQESHVHGLDIVLDYVKP